MTEKNSISSALDKRDKKRNILFISLELKYYYLGLYDLKRLANQTLIFLKILRARICIALDNFGGWLARYYHFGSVTCHPSVINC